MALNSPYRISIRFQGSLSPRIAARARAAASEAAAGVARLAGENARDHAARFSRSGKFRDSIASRFRREGDRFVGEVYSDAPYAAQVERRHGVLTGAVRQAVRKLRGLFHSAFSRRIG